MREKRREEKSREATCVSWKVNSDWTNDLRCLGEGGCGGCLCVLVNS